MTDKVHYSDRDFIETQRFGVFFGDVFSSENGEHFIDGDGDGEMRERERDQRDNLSGCIAI